MIIDKLTYDMNIIGKLDDNPALTPSQLKSAFDEAGIEIKRYINETLIPKVQSGSLEDIEQAKSEIFSSIESQLVEFEGRIDLKMQEIDAQIDAFMENISSLIETTTKSTEFAITGDNGSIVTGHNIKQNNMVIMATHLSVNVPSMATLQVATIPEGYRPKKEEVFYVSGTASSSTSQFQGNSYRVVVGIDGKITVNNPGSNVRISQLFLNLTYLI